MGNYQIILFIVAGIGMMALLGGLMFLSNQYSLNGIKSKTVGDDSMGQPVLQQKRKFGKRM